MPRDEHMHKIACFAREEEFTPGAQAILRAALGAPDLSDADLTLIVVAAREALVGFISCDELIATVGEMLNRGIYRDAV